LVWAHDDGTVNTWELNANGDYVAHTSVTTPDGAVVADHQSLLDDTGRRLWAFEDGSARIDIIPLPYSEVFSRIQIAYENDDGAFYDEQLRHLGAMVRRMVPTECARAERAAVELGCRENFDGLEPVVLTLRDCAATPITTGPTYEYSLLTSWYLDACLHYTAAPRDALPGMVTLYNGTSSTALPGNVLRATLAHLQEYPMQRRPWTNLADLASSPALRQRLCALPPRLTEIGLPALHELLRMAECRTGHDPGGAMARADACVQALAATHDDNGRPQTLQRDANQPVAAPGTHGQVRELSSHELERIAAFCGNTGSPVSQLRGSLLDGHGVRSCDEPNSTPEVLEFAELAQTVEACLGSQGLVNPVAGGTDGCFGTCGKTYLYDSHVDATSQHPSRGDADGEAWTGLGLMIQTFFSKLHDDWEEEREAAKWRAESDGHGRSRDGEPVDPAEFGSDVGDVARGGWADPDPNTAVAGGLGWMFAGGNLRNPACQEMARSGLLNGHRGEFWDTFFQRGPQRDPNREYPNPADDGANPHHTQDQSCEGTDTTVIGHCGRLIMCSEGLMPDATCQCRRPSAEAVRDMCLGTDCGPDAVPVPIGGGACMCQESRQDLGPGRGPIDPRTPSGDGPPREPGH
jgi:hypothetical protein